MMLHHSISSGIRIVAGFLVLTGDSIRSSGRDINISYVSAFVPIRSLLHRSKHGNNNHPRALDMATGGSNPLDAGSGIYYDADPSRMEQMMAAASAQQGRSTSNSGDDELESALSAPETQEAAAAAAAATASSSSSSSKSIRRPTRSSIPKDVVIIGSGLAGLSAALHIATTTSRHVTILDREDPQAQKIKTTAGSFAAAGMLAPQSERLPIGPLLDLCLESRDMYGEFVEGVEEWARNCGREGERYLWKDGKTDDDGRQDGYGATTTSNTSGGHNNLEPWEVGFTAAGGFLAPAFAGDAVATWAPPSQSGTARWLDAVQVRELEPQLHKDVVGGWWFPEDASVDARRLTCSLRAACVGAGVQFMCGKECEATSLDLSGEFFVFFREEASWFDSRLIVDSSLICIFNMTDPSHTSSPLSASQRRRNLPWSSLGRW